MRSTGRSRPSLLGALVLLAAACSGGSDDGGSVETGSEPTVTESTSTTTVTETTASPSTTQPPLPAVEIDVLIYNVAGLPDILSGSEPATNTALIGPLLNDYGLVLLQETWLTPDEPPLGLRTYHEILLEASTHPFASTPLPAPLGTDPDRPTAELSDGLNRFSDFAFDSDAVTRRRWTTCGEESADCLSLKGFSMARTTLPNGLEVDVYNLHMDAGRVDAPVRGENVAELSAFIASESTGRAVIVGGDFNLHLDRDPDADQFMELLSSVGLTDVCTSVGCDDPNRIDKVLIRSSDDVVIDAVEWRNDSALFTRSDGEPLSDHEPVVVRLRVSAA